MTADSKMTPGMATALLVNAAKQGDLSLMQQLINQGANPGCWVDVNRGRWTRQPLATVMARQGAAQSAIKLLAHITDAVIERSNMGDWRADYDLSPLPSFTIMGLAREATLMLSHCKDSMTQEQWSDLLSLRVCCAASKETDDPWLIAECVAHLDDGELLQLKQQIIAKHQVLPAVWAAVEACSSLRGLQDQTCHAAARHVAINRM